MRATDQEGAALRLDWPASATRFLVLRLLPGDDLRGSIEAAVAAEPERAGFVAAAVGSLSRLAIRPAGLEEATILASDMEIVALSGTLSEDGPHLHVAVADADGRVTGGHLLAGSVVRTTAEIVLGLASGVVFARPVDPRTGWRELVARRD